MTNISFSISEKVSIMSDDSPDKNPSSLESSFEFPVIRNAPSEMDALILRLEAESKSLPCPGYGTETRPDTSPPTTPSDATASSLATMMSLFRSFVGIGNFSLPFAFSLVGIIVGPMGSVFVFAILGFGAYQIVDAAQRLQDEFGMSTTDLGTCFEAALSVGPAWIGVAFAHRGKKIVQSFACVMQVVFFGPCVVFVAKNVKEAANIDWSDRLCILCAFPILVAMGMIRSTDFLNGISSVGNVAFLVGYVVVFQWIVQDPLPLEDLSVDFRITLLPKFISTCVYMFEGVIPLLHLRTKMQKPKQMLGCNGVLLTVLNFMAIIFLAIGFFGYSKYGPDTKATIILNLPNEPLYDSLRIIFSVVLITMFPVQMLPVVDIVFHQHLLQWHPILQRSPRLFETFFRFALAVLAISFPLLYPSLGDLISLFGTLMGIPLAVLLPNTLQLLVRYQSGDYGPKRFRLFLNLFLIVVAFVFLVCGTIDGVVNIINFVE